MSARLTRKYRGLSKTMTENNLQGAATPKSVVVRQAIFCLAALGIMGAGAWSLTGQTAPYHPDAFSDEVTRNEVLSLD